MRRWVARDLLTSLWSVCPRPAATDQLCPIAGRLTIGLTERGRGAAKVLAAAGVTVDDELMVRVGTHSGEFLPRRRCSSH